MVRITESLIRKRAEHNNLEISTLEEVSLHQQDVEKIEHLDKWCRELRILYLQSNLIPKIENVGRLKKLEYLNLALNNIEKIENLENCESLQKLDLTVNFVGELTSIENLKDLPHFNELYLTGNPCTEYEGYRKYTIATLPHLKLLDGKHVERSERIIAQQDVGVLRGYIIEQQNKYRKKREKEKEEISRQVEQRKNKTAKKEENPGFDGKWYTDTNNTTEKDVNKENEQNAENGIQGQNEGNGESDKEKEEEGLDSDEEEKKFWEEKVPFTPESRVAVHEHMKKVKEKEEKKKEPPPKKPRQLFTADGRPLNVNEAKIDFTLTEDDNQNSLLLDVACFKHMDTSLIDCDVQTNYVRVTLKGKTFQLCLPEDVNPDSSSAKRSQVTGHLLVTMPKAKQILKAKKPTQEKKDNSSKKPEKSKGVTHDTLEVDKSAHKSVNYQNIVKDKSEQVVPPLGHKKNKFQVKERPNSEDFVDDLDVPPLE